MQIGFIADPVSTFHPEAETTFFLLYESNRRGHSNWVMEMGDLFTEEGPRVKAKAKKLQVAKKGKRFFFQILDEKILNLAHLDCLFLRKDPPVDLDYVNHLNLLALCQGPLFINAPSGILKANEKLYPLYFPHISPPSLVSSSLEELTHFVKEYGKVVVKPLNSGGGKGIFILEAHDSDLRSLLEIATEGKRRYVLVQKYLPESKKGDKRLLIFGGELLGAFLRIPARGDFRGNMHSGARWAKTTVGPREKLIVKILRERLLSEGLLFVGVDMIGSYVTEINTTSPMGIREVNELYGVKCERRIFDWIEHKVKSKIQKSKT